MNNIDLMSYWIKSSDKDYEVMLDLKEKIEIHMLCFLDNYLLKNY